MRTVVQLIEAATGNHLWAEKYDRFYADIFDVQDEVVSDIAGVPRYATARVILAIAYESTAGTDEARAAVERACELDPGLNVDGIVMNARCASPPRVGSGARGDPASVLATRLVFARRYAHA